MPSMQYDEAAAERLEDVYLGTDMVAQRQDTLRRLDIKAGEHIVDIGSGPGFLAQDMAEQTGPSGRVVGVDLSRQMVERATARSKQGWLSYKEADATELPFADGSFDIAVSTQVAEYVPDITAFCREVARVLKPGGRGLIIATDWDAVCWYSEFPDRMRRVLDAFASHCADSRLPRTLAGHLRSAGLTVVDVGYFPIINLDRYDGCYEAGIVPFITAYIMGQQILQEAELTEWAKEQEALDDRGEHFFSSGRFIFTVQKQ